MKEFATNKENKSLKITDRVIALSGKDYHVWEVKAEHITTLNLTDNNRSLDIKVNVLGQKEAYSVVFPKEIYVQVKTFFMTKLKNVKVRKLSKIRQMMGPLMLVAIFGVLAGVLFFLAREIESTGEALEGGSNSGFMSSIANFLTEQFGSQGILLGGGILVGLFSLFILKAYLFPKKGATVIFKYGNQVINYAAEAE